MLQNSKQTDEHAYVYCFVRRDLSQPQIAVQSSHACIDACKLFDFASLSEHPSVIMLGVKTETQLENVCKRLEKQGIRFASFREPDIGDQLTSVCTEPVSQEQRAIFKKYQLLKGDC